MQVVQTPYFVANVNFYVDKKRYRKIGNDVKPVLETLEKGNLIGNIVPNLNIPEDTHVYKVRVANSSANVGKSNGFRILYYATIGDTVYLLSIYSKKDDDRVLNNQQIEFLVNNLVKIQEEYNE